MMVLEWAQLVPCNPRYGVEELITYSISIQYLFTQDTCTPCTKEVHMIFVLSIHVLIL